VVVLVAVLLTTGLLVGCGRALIGSGNLKTQEYTFSDFNKVEVSSAFEFDISQSGTYGISITADDNVIEKVQVTKEGETLKIGLKTVTMLGPVTLEAKVTMPQLIDLDISGASKGTVSGFSSTENLDIDVSGASSIELVDISTGDAKFDVSGASKVTGGITAGDADFDIDGASTVQLEGSAGDMVVDAGGASRVKLAGFTVNNVDVNLDGASTGTVNLAGRLDADLDGASKLEYIGEPTMGTINTSGASTLNKK